MDIEDRREISLRKKVFIGILGSLIVVITLSFWIKLRPDLLLYDGDVVEIYYPSDSIKSRTQMKDDLANGWSQGWYTNGQLQVTEHFVDGVSDGLRTKWHMSGEKKSEAEIVNGQIHGHFRRWYENGQLAEDAAFSKDIPHGLSQAWFEDGSQKAEVTMEHGTVVAQQFWSEGEKRP